MGICLTFKNMDTLAVKVKSFIQEVKKKDRTLALARATLTKVEVAIFKTNKTLDSSHKTTEELEASLKEAREGWKKTKVELREMRLENL